MALPAAALAVQAIKSTRKVTVNKNVTAVLLSTALGLGLFFAGRALLRSFRRNIRENRALDRNAPENFALRLVMAFENDMPFGWGTDEELVYRTLEEIPNAFVMNRVEKVFPDFDGNRRNLSVVLKSELSSEEFAIADAIINSKT